LKKSILWMKKIVLPTLLAFVLSIVILSAGMALPIPTIAQTNSTTTVYLDPPTKNATLTDIDQEFTVNIMISDSPEIFAWQVGINFNATVLNCTGFYEGEFLKTVGPTEWTKGTINNETGVITPHNCFFTQRIKRSGSGRLAYVNFTVIAQGVSDLHLSGVKLVEDPTTYKEAPCNIIDVYTVVSDTRPYTVVIVGNLTGVGSVRINGLSLIISGFSDHAFSEERISFKVKSVYPSFSNVRIPKELIPVDDLAQLTAIIDGTPLKIEERTVTYNGTHYSISFTYTSGIHEVQIAKVVPSNISIALSSGDIALGENITISGKITPLQQNVTVTIECKPSGGTWTTIENVTTNSNSNYSYPWTPETAGTYEVKAKWYGNPYTYGAESDVLTLTVKGAQGISLEIILAVVVAIIIIAAVVIYFVKIRKPE
jgi:hypothetical protein